MLEGAAKIWKTAAMKAEAAVVAGLVGYILALGEC
jgi:hypothetical protein